MMYPKNLYKRVLSLVPDKLYLQIMFKHKLGYWMNFKDPKTFNEKIQWLKLHDRNPLYTTLVDKYMVKSYVADIIGQEYIIPTYGVWDSFDDIDFDQLPDQFVLKCTHDSGGIVICQDKKNLDLQLARKKITDSLHSDYYLYGREWPYKNVKRRILAEKFMKDSNSEDLIDYKFFTFNGTVKAMFVATDRFSDKCETKFDFYDDNFNHLDLRNGHPNSNLKIKKPVNFDKMKELAEQLSHGIKEVRVDFYEVNGKIYFGEMTFFHYSGFVPFEPKEWDQKFGAWIELP